MKIKAILTLALSLTVLAEGRLAAECSTAASLDTVNGLLDALTPALNTAWPSLAVSSGLDPWKDVYKGKINIGCKYGGDEICGLQASSCKKFYVEVDLSKLTGLSYLQFKELQATTTNAAAGTQACKHDTKVSQGPYSCSYWGSGSGKAYLLSGAALQATLSKLKVKVKCNNFLAGDFTETLYSGSATCKSSDSKGSATLDYCGGACQSGSPAANLSYLAVDDLELKLGKLSCDVKPDYSTVSWIAEILVPELKDTIANTVEPTIEKALNDLLADSIPFPSACK